MDNLSDLATSVTKMLETTNTWFMVLSTDMENIDLLIKKLALDGNHVDYYIDQVDLPTYLLSPEILDLIINKVFVRTIDGIKLKAKYDVFRYLAPNNCSYLSIDLCIPLTDTLLSCCLKRATINSQSNMRYGPIGNSPTETCKQQIENFILSDRCDRIFAYPQINSPIEETINKILEENGKKIKLIRIILGSFSNIQYTNKSTKYIYVIDD